MQKQPKKITIQEFHQINQSLKQELENCVGNYLINGFRVQISKYQQSGSDRVMFIFNKRRALGLCIVCSKKVKRVNRITGKLYRLCDVHRATIDNYKGK